jgi:hypothetical protein
MIPLFKGLSILDDIKDVSALEGRSSYLPTGRQKHALKYQRHGCAGLERLEVTSDGLMARDLSPLSLLQNLQFLQLTSFNDVIRYPIHPAVLALPVLRELSLRTLGLDMIQVRASLGLSLSCPDGCTSSFTHARCAWCDAETMATVKWSGSRAKPGSDQTWYTLRKAGL